MRKKSCRTRRFARWARASSKWGIP